MPSTETTSTSCRFCEDSRLVPVLVSDPNAESRIEMTPCPICSARPAYDPTGDTMAFGEIMASPWLDGMMAGRAHDALSTNPHRADTQDWRDWLHGYEDAAKMRWLNMEMPEPG